MPNPALGINANEESDKSPAPELGAGEDQGIRGNGAEMPKPDFTLPEPIPLIPRAIELG